MAKDCNQENNTGYSNADISKKEKECGIGPMCPSERCDEALEIRMEAAFYQKGLSAAGCSER